MSLTLHRFCTEKKVTAVIVPSIIFFIMVKCVNQIRSGTKPGVNNFHQAFCCWNTLNFNLLYINSLLSAKNLIVHTGQKKGKGQKTNISLKWRSLTVELAECTLDWTHNLLFNSIHLHLCSSKLAVASLNWQESCRTSWAETSQFPDFHRTPIKFSL